MGLFPSVSLRVEPGWRFDATLLKCQCLRKSERSRKNSRARSIGRSSWRRNGSTTSFSLPPVLESSLRSYAPKDSRQAVGCFLLALQSRAGGSVLFLEPRHLLAKMGVLLADWKALQIKLGQEPHTIDDRELADRALKGLHEKKLAFDNTSRKLGRWQFRVFLLGGLFYIAGHALHILGSPVPCRPDASAAEGTGTIIGRLRGEFIHGSIPYYGSVVYLIPVTASSETWWVGLARKSVV